jgi:hypothetical protein
MDQTRKMWASAAVVGAIVAGGVSIAAAASAGRLDQAGEETRVVVEKAPSSSRAPEPTDDIVVHTDVNPDPGKVLEYWTDDRLEDAQPMPMPEVSPGELSPGEFQVTE